ncbi:hypothetical protein EUGRSUZ_B02452 [Eucalyptus grandis]|uniref:Uncharacterized protein n=2 Tax=Eucalyptus grandis TaxID=71139 RepID=A0ACC3LUW0_EUCGR|nr:hypothetical protein EUGRSUZ_B02452 [Eucalyptus grandis]
MSIEVFGDLWHVMSVCSSPSIMDVAVQTEMHMPDGAEESYHSSSICGCLLDNNPTDLWLSRDLNAR